MSKRAPYVFEPPPADGPRYWRSLEERARQGDPELRQELAKEFRDGHTSTPPSEEATALNRRGFLTIMGAALALAGAEGCRRPLEKILPYAKMPEQVIPGVPVHYATVINRRGEALGLLVETHEGRPTKVEGNPNHPASQGGADILAQATVLDLYDPDRTPFPSHRKDAKSDRFESDFMASLRHKVQEEAEYEEMSKAVGKQQLTQAELDEAIAERLKKFEKEPESVLARKVATWAFLEKDLDDALGAARDGDKLRVLMPPTNSPTVMRLRAEVRRRFPRARFHVWSAVNESNVRDGARLAFGQPMTPVYAFDKATVVLSLDSDFLQTEPGAVRANKGYARRRRLPLPPGETEMSRLYVVEPSFTTTGSNADHRLRLPAADVEKFLLALVNRLAAQGVSPGADIQAAAQKQGDAPANVPPKFLDAVAKDLRAHPGKSVIVVGSRQPPVVHAIGHALNAALRNVDQTVKLFPPVDPEETDQLADIKDLATSMANGGVDTLIMIGGNPAYDAPADLGFAQALDKVGYKLHLSSHVDETGSLCTWSVPRAHEFESWGDQKTTDGVVTIQQPLIRPLQEVPADEKGGGGAPGAWSDIELLARLARTPVAERSGYALVRRTTQMQQLAELGCAPTADPNVFNCTDRANNKSEQRRYQLDAVWKKALRDGVVAPRAGAVNAPAPPANARAIAAAIDQRQPTASPSPKNLEVTFAPCPKMLDGRHGNNPWLLEMPDPMTKLVWDNAAIMSRATAEAHGLSSGDHVKLTLGALVAYAGVWVLPGQADNSISVTLGWGRRKAGRLGNMKGFDVYPLRGSTALHFASGVTLSKPLPEKYKFGQTQDHDSMEGRAIAMETTFDDYRARPNFPELDSPPPKKLPLWNDQPYVLGNEAAIPDDPVSKEMYRYQWGMAIDLNACTGCNACVIACMSENNVPVVGKVEVARGREMLWLRMDRYFVDTPVRSVEAEVGRHERLGNPSPDDPLVSHQPLMCVHCEEAPCENVCPVNATVHSTEGLNEMAYNRCIGTRYCANNCPYKVRRFNYLNWHNDGVWTFAEPYPETYSLQTNPNVSVRFRGVMEKCTYCVQRIQAAKIHAKRDNRTIRDGEIVTACQQTCPADAIMFGDLHDKTSKVSAWTELDRGYKLLAELGTKPRTTYLGKVRNPHPDLVAVEERAGGPKGESKHEPKKEKG